MPGSTISVCNEPEEFEAALRHGGHVDLIVTARGQFRSRLIRIALPRVSLLTTEETLPRIAFISRLACSTTVIVPLDRESSQVWAGLSLCAGTIVTISGGHPVHARTDGRCSTGVICLSTKDLARFGTALLGSGLGVPPGVHLWQPQPSAFRALTDLVNAAVHVTAGHPPAPANAEAAHGLEQQLIAALVACLSGQALEGGIATRRRHTDILARLETIIRTHPDRLPAVADISTALGISARTLRTCCHEHLGMAPGRYLHLRQLQRIHRGLHRADPTRTRVSEFARRYGVTELGRFAGNYRDLFGELPSVTLRRRALAVPVGRERGSK